MDNCKKPIKFQMLRKIVNMPQKIEGLSKNYRKIQKNLRNSRNAFYALKIANDLNRPKYGQKVSIK